MEKIYLPAQVSMLMPSDMYKTMITLFAFQKEGVISYSKKNCEFLHLDQAICDQAVQTAIDYKLIKPLEEAGSVYRFKINAPVIEAAKLSPLTDIPGKALIKLSETITFKQEMGSRQPSTEALLEQIRQLQAQLMNQVKNENNDGNDGLPW